LGRLPRPSSSVTAAAAAAAAAWNRSLTVFTPRRTQARNLALASATQGSASSEAPLQLHSC
jgi:hypothetical protein